MRCVACRCDAPTVTKAEIAELHPQVAELEIVEHEGIEHLLRVFPSTTGPCIARTSSWPRKPTTCSG
jgi:hypothetical protein